MDRSARIGVRRLAVAAAFAIVFAGLLAGSLATAAPARAAGDDISEATLREGDLPRGFDTVSKEALAEAGLSTGALGDSLAEAFQRAKVQSYTAFADRKGGELVFAFVVGPLTEAESASLVRDLRDTEARADFVESFAESLTMFFMDAEEPRELDVSDVGDESIGIALHQVAEDDTKVFGELVDKTGREVEAQTVVGLRGDYISVVVVMRIGADPPHSDIVTLAGVVDRRLARAQGVGFRDTDVLVPAISTFIPTPLDLSTDPRVVFTNLLLAAIATLVLAVATRLLNTTLAAREDALERVLRPSRWLRDGWRRFDERLHSRLKRPGAAGAVRLGLILLFYGIAFSLLEPGWNPFTINGLYLLFAMSVAFGIVGIADDIVEWRAARRLGVPADFAAKPGLVLVAITSVAGTRLFGIVPGIMIGTPEAFDVDKSAADATRLRRLSTVGLWTIVGVGLGVWALTTGTDLLLRTDLPRLAEVLVGGLQALLLILFAVAAENLFVEMLGFRDSKGEIVRRKNRWLWVAALLASTALFFHALLNPEGRLSEAVESTNVVVFMATVAVFAAFSVVVWWRLRPRPVPAAAVEGRPVVQAVDPTGIAASAAESPAADQPAVAAEWVCASEPVAPAVSRSAPVAAPAMESPVAQERPAAAIAAVTPALTSASVPPAIDPVTATGPALTGASPAWSPVPVDGTKTCPACGATIRAAARLCRFCRAVFTLAHTGYCGACRAWVATDSLYACPGCARPTTWGHVQTWIAEPLALPGYGGGWAGSGYGVSALASPRSTDGPGRRTSTSQTRSTRGLIVTLCLAAAVLLLALLMVARDCAGSRASVLPSRGHATVMLAGHRHSAIPGGHYDTVTSLRFDDVRGR